MTIDDRKITKAQRIYDESVNTYLTQLDKLTSEMPEIMDIMYGYSRGYEEPKYRISAGQYSALKDMYNIWKSNLKEPDKVLENIGNELKRKYKERKNAVENPTEAKGKQTKQEQEPPKPAVVFRLQPVQK